MNLWTPLATLALFGMNLVGAWAEPLVVQASMRAGDVSFEALAGTYASQLFDATGGRVNLALKPAGALIAPSDTPSAVAAGIIDGDLASTSYFSARDPALALLGDPIGAFQTPEELRAFCRDGPGEALLQQALDRIVGGGVVVVGCGPIIREALVSRVPIRSIADFRGLRVRTPDGLTAAIFRALGAEPVDIPYTEIRLALEAGVIDAADAGPYADNDAAGLHLVAPFPIHPGILSMPVMQFTLSREAWSRIKPHDRQIMRAWWYASLAALQARLAKRDAELAARDRTAGDIEVIDWPEEERRTLNEIAREAWGAFTLVSPTAREVSERLKARAVPSGR